MISKQRIDLIEHYIREHQYADLHTLAKKFDISLSTVRRALNELEAKEVVRRHHGGASLIDNEVNAIGYDFITQDDRYVDEKHSIAQYIADLVEPNMTVILDGGTTTYTVARLLVSKRIIVITNSLPIAVLFNEISSMETIVTGGTVYHRLGVLLGPTCENSLSQMHADLAILGGAGITEEGIWNSNSFIVSAQKKILKAADKSIFAIDNSKFGKRALELTTSFKSDFIVVTNEKPESQLSRAIRSAGTKLKITT